MNIFRGFLAIVTALTLIPIVIFGTLILATTSTYLNPDFYRSDTFEDLFYDVIVTEISSQLIENQAELGKLLEANDIKEEVRTVITPEIVSSTIEDALIQINQIPLPDEIIISTGAIKANLPLAIDSLFKKMQPNLPIELPIDSIKEQFQNEIIDYIPSQVSLPLSELPQEARNGLAIIILGLDHFLESFLLSVGLHLAIIGLLIWKPAQKILKWIGAAILASGIITFAFIKTLMIGTESFEELITLIAEPILGTMYPWSIGFIIAGIACLALGFILPHTILMPTKNE